MLEVKLEVFLITESDSERRRIVEEHAAKKWHGLQVAAHRELFDLKKLPCLIAVSEGEILGYCYFHYAGESEMEIIAMESMQRGRGIAGLLIKGFTELAKNNSCHRVFFTITNDNTNAMSFYQHKGFTMAALRLGEVEYLRKLKPGIPLVGYNDIPILHELEFEMMVFKHHEY